MAGLGETTPRRANPMGTQERPDPNIPIDWASLPMGATPDTDRVVSMDDAGRPVYQTMFGDRYVINYEMQTQEGLPQRAGNALSALAADPVGVAGNAIGGMAQGVWNGLMVPGRAARGATITNGELFNTIGLMAGGAGAMKAPAGSLRSGALRTGESLTPAQMAAEDVLTRLRSGQGASVTDEMMAAADPQYLWSNYDLPMDQASRMARAQEMGFDTVGYHGTKLDFQEFVPKKNIYGPNGDEGHVFFGSQPEVANSSAGGTIGATVIPVKVKPVSKFSGGMLQDNPNATYLADSFSPLGNDFARYMDDMGELGEDVAGYASEGQWDLIEGPQFQSWMRGKGFKDYEVREAGEQNFAVTDPSRIRSQFARFDPRLSHLKNLSAGLAALGLTSLASMFDPEAQGGM